MRVLSLFSGIGGFDLGLERAGMKIVGQIEIDDYCTKILEKHWPKVRKWRDIRTVSAHDIRRACRKIDLVCGGFPCQDISTAGKGEGLTGDRSGLWREMWRLIRGLRPSWVLIENVPALRTRGADGILNALETIGYTCRPLVVGAWAVGASHKRDRVWIIGTNAHGKRRKRERCSWLPSRFAQSPYRDQESWEDPRTLKPTLALSIYGIPSRLAIKAIGNAVVPQAVEAIGRAILEIEK